MWSYSIISFGDSRQMALVLIKRQHWEEVREKKHT